MRESSAGPRRADNTLFLSDHGPEQQRNSSARYHFNTSQLLIGLIQLVPSTCIVAYPRAIKNTTVCQKDQQTKEFSIIPLLVCSRLTRNDDGFERGGFTLTDIIGGQTGLNKGAIEASVHTGGYRVGGMRIVPLKFMTRWITIWLS